MIPADTMKVITTLQPRELELILKGSDYSGCSFKSSEFLGLTNGAEFCYKVTYHNDDGQGDAAGKVFVKYNTSDRSMTAELT